MTADSDIWSAHLQPGERLLWTAAASPAMRRADLSRHRLLYGAAATASLLIALLLLVRFVESLLINAAQPSMLAAFMPLYLVFALAMLALALWGFRRMAEKSPSAQHYAATQTRLLALDTAGALFAQMPGADIEQVIASGRRRTPDVYVLRKDDPREEHVFAIEHIERPLDAKAVIEDTFLPPAPAGAASTEEPQ